MLLGIDVGGTNTDAVLLEKGEILAVQKVPTRTDNLIVSILLALENILEGHDPQAIENFNLSTTLPVNAILEKKIESVGVFVTGGPGITPEAFEIGENYQVIPGWIDHRGHEISPLNTDRLDKVISYYSTIGLHNFAVVGKFALRNPKHELAIAGSLPKETVVTLGHRISGVLNFPRRLVTAYYNSAIFKTFSMFADAITSGCQALGINCPIHILKADGGTLPLNIANKVPVHTIHSGPAASVLGMQATHNEAGDAIILDIGGTTTDISVLAQGNPLLEKEGIAIAGRSSAVRAIQTRSIGVGGESRIRIIKDDVFIGPERTGPSLADGGSNPTLIDAFILLGLTEFSNVMRSKELFAAFAEGNGRRPRDLAQHVVSLALTQIRDNVNEFVRELNERPVYTIHDMLHPDEIKPQKVILMGSPSPTFKKQIEALFNLPTEYSEYYKSANAIGAALAQTTVQAELFADTSQGRLVMPELNLFKKINHLFKEKDAQKFAVHSLLNLAKNIDNSKTEQDIDITHSNSYPMIQNGKKIGLNIRVNCQLRPSLRGRVIKNY